MRRETEGESLRMDRWMDTHHQVSVVPDAAHQPLAKLLAQQMSPAYTLPDTQVSQLYEPSWLTLKASGHQDGDLLPVKCLRLARNGGRKSAIKRRASSSILLYNSHTFDCFWV